jgi:hypothetical protein
MWSNRRYKALSDMNLISQTWRPPVSIMRGRPRVHLHVMWRLRLRLHLCRKYLTLLHSLRCLLLPIRREKRQSAQAHVTVSVLHRQTTPLQRVTNYWSKTHWWFRICRGTISGACVGCIWGFDSGGAPLAILGITDILNNLQKKNLKTELPYSKCKP